MWKRFNTSEKPEYSFHTIKPLLIKLYHVWEHLVVDLYADDKGVKKKDGLIHR